jgi:superfamily II DNA or RNA helicase
MDAMQFQPGNLVQARGREWVVLPESEGKVLALRPLGGGDQITRILVPLEHDGLQPASFPPPDPAITGSRSAGLLLRDALMLTLRAGAGPFRSFGNIAVEPRPYQLVPLLMALRLATVRLLIADDVGIGKTIEAALIARELLDRGEISAFTVLCPPHLCEQWQEELLKHFNIQAEIVRTSTAGRLERGLPAGKSLFEATPFTIVSLDYIKSDRRRDEFLRACPEFVIIDEAHSCTQGQTTSRHLRYQLLKGLAEDVSRHMVFLTATPHSGDDEAFFNLLGLLDPAFRQLGQLEGKERNRMREQLGRHFVQRRRPDIEEWQDNNLFPDRLTRETTYRLTGDWGRMFNDVLEYAREMIRKGEGLGAHRQRMNWWAALALLRCISSSPAAAEQALRTRIRDEEADGLSELTKEQEEALAATVFDSSEDNLVADDTIPGALTSDNAVYLGVLLEQAKDLRGPRADPKLKALIREIKELTQKGFHPVVFCRYIATAHYVAEHVGKAFKDYTVTAVTGQLTPSEREERVMELGDYSKRVLIATDCLSEGINLQEHFDAVVHYDLSWNPTRHEQREGRVDRFGQKAKEVRAVMLYGEDNPVDGAVLKVILRKAERIRKELGVMVPMPEDENKITEAVLQAVLMGKGQLDTPQIQLDLSLDEIEEYIESKWESLREKAAKNRTIFAQRRLHPEDVLPEWEKAMSALGREEDVARFVSQAAERLGAPLESRGEVRRLPVRHLPPALKDRLAVHQIEERLDLAFQYPAPPSAVTIHRTYPLVAELAGYITEVALDGEQPDIASRATAIFTGRVKQRTVLWLLRLRVQITLTRADKTRTLLAEEAITLSQAGEALPEFLSPDQARNFLATPAERNMAPELRSRHVRRALEQLHELQPRFNALAQQRAEAILADHRRVRDAAEARGSYQVEAMLPMDVVGCYVLIPARSF